jgi:acetoacetyl-CoA synthetase
MPGGTTVVVVPYLSDGSTVAGLAWAELTGEPAPLDLVAVPSDHPLYILYSSGTTGVPKAIVHSHGGILVEHLKMLALHLDIRAGDTFFWFSTTGWMMWNYLVSGLLLGATVVLYDGDPFRPEPDALWRMAAELGVTHFGVSAGYLMACRKEGLRPGAAYDLSRIRHLGSTGSPLPAEGFDWVYEHVGRDLVLGSASGGSDVCSAFVGAAPLLPVWRGEISGRCLGAAVAAFDPAGRPVTGELGELVVTEPLPSMPVGLWGDDTGERLREAYYATYPGVWRHGDWIELTDRGSCVITGRSDATLNRGGVRMGTAEFYRVVERLDEVADSLVVHQDAGADDRLSLFVALRPGRTLTADLRDRLVRAIRSELSPRYVPDAIIEVGAIPRTLTGKKLEVPVKRMLSGAAPAEVASADALVDPGALEALAEAVRKLSVTPPPR